MTDIGSVEAPLPEIDLGWILLRVATRLERLQTEALAELDAPLTFRQYRLLVRIQEGHRSPTALARAVRRSPPTISDSIDVLVKRQLVAREPSPENRRAVPLAVTTQGIRALEEARSTLESLTSALTKELSVDDREALTRILGEVYDVAGTYLNPRT